MPGHLGGVLGLINTAEGEKWLWEGCGREDSLSGGQGVRRKHRHKRNMSQE